MNVLTNFIGAMTFAIVLGPSANASTLLTIQGHVKQINSGIVEIQSKSGTQKLILKKLSADSQKEIQVAMQQHRDIVLTVSPEMIAKK
jgi:hypothetical protein